MNQTMSESRKWSVINYRLIALPLAVAMASPSSAQISYRQNQQNQQFQENIQRGWDRLEQRGERNQEELNRRSGVYWSYDPPDPWNPED